MKLGFIFICAGLMTIYTFCFNAAYAQQQQKSILQIQIESQLGAMLVDSIAAKLRIDELIKERDDLKKHLEDKEKK